MSSQHVVGFFKNQDLVFQTSISNGLHRNFQSLFLGGYATHLNLFLKRFGSGDSPRKNDPTSSNIGNYSLQNFDIRPPNFFEPSPLSWQTLPHFQNPTPLVGPRVKRRVNPVQPLCERGERARKWPHHGQEWWL